MPTDMHDLLAEAAGPHPGTAPEERILRRASARRARRRVAQATLSLVLVAGLTAVTLNQLARPRVELADQPPIDAVPACIAGGGEGCNLSVDKRNRFSWRFPDRWFESKTVLQGGVDDRLRTVATLSTPLVDDPDETLHGSMRSCPVPLEALQSAGDEGALIALQMARSKGTRGFEPRPERFGDAGAGVQQPTPRCAGSNVVRYTFTDTGRDFRAYVILRPRASDVTRDAALAVLDTLRVEPAG